MGGHVLDLRTTPTPPAPQRTASCQLAASLSVLLAVGPARRWLGAAQPAATKLHTSGIINLFLKSAADTRLLRPPSAPAVQFHTKGDPTPQDQIQQSACP